MARLLLIAAGGTGGHMFPAQALAEAMIARGWRVKLSTDARGARAVHALGAEGVFAGSVFISTIESRVPDSVKAKIVAANGLDLRLFRTLPDYYRALPGKLSDTLVAMDRAGASRTELAQAMGGLRGMRLGMLEGNTDEGYISVGAGIGNIHAITSVAEVVNQLAV